MCTLHPQAPDPLTPCDQVVVPPAALDVEVALFVQPDRLRFEDGLNLCPLLPGTAATTPAQYFGFDSYTDWTPREGRDLRARNCALEAREDARHDFLSPASQFVSREPRR